MSELTASSVVELSLFAAQATRADIEELCEEARNQNFYAVCVNGSRVELAHSNLEESTVQIVALIGFPLGATDSDAKRYEAEIAADQGAHEIDFVINLGRLKDGDSKYVLREMLDIVEAADERPVKTVIESHRLTPEEKSVVCALAAEAGVKFVSASTGFHAPATTLEDVKLLRQAAGPDLGVKVWALPADAAAFIEAGATRIGAPFISRQ
jgi:deoxyribose-phosphate aldolase